MKRNRKTYKVGKLLPSQVSQAYMIHAENNGFMGLHQFQEMIGYRAIHSCGIHDLSDGSEVLVGFGCFSFTDRSLVIQDIAIERARHRSSFGSKLLDHFSRIILQTKRKYVDVFVQQHNQPAIKFFQSNGFECVKLETQYFKFRLGGERSFIKRLGNRFAQQELLP